MKSWQAEVFFFIFGKRLTNHTGVKDGKRTHTLTLSFSNTRTALASRRPLVTAMTGKVYMTAHRVIVDYSLIQHKSEKKKFFKLQCIKNDTRLSEIKKQLLEIINRGQYRKNLGSFCYLSQNFVYW